MSRGISDKLAEAIEDVPSDVNPYKWLAQSLNQSLVPETGRWFNIILFVAYGLQGAGLVLALTLLAFKAIGHTFWLSHTKPVLNGRLIIFNNTLCFGLLHTVHYIFVIPLTYFLQKSFFHDGDPLYYQALVPFAFAPIALLGWLNSHSCLATLLLAWPTLSGSGAVSPSFALLEKSLSQHSKIIARGVNIFSIFGMVTTALFSIAIFSVATHQYQELLDIYQALQTALVPLVADWEEDQELRFTPAVLRQSTRFVERSKGCGHWLSAGFLILTISLCLMLVVYIPTMSLYLHLLSRQLRRRSVLPANSGQDDQAVNPTARTYISIVLESVLVLCLSLMFLVLSTWVAVNPENVLGDPAAVTWMWSSILVAYNVVALPLLCLMTIRTAVSSECREKLWRRGRQGTRPSSDDFPGMRGRPRTLQFLRASSTYRKL